MSDALQIKELFGRLLDAQEATDESSATRARAEAEAALAAASESVREAVRQLLEAHRRASGVLLERSEGAKDERDQGEIIVEAPRIDGYEIGDELGRGGFGIVYRARQTSPVERDVAVKILRTEFATPEIVARFRAEARLLARMNHPGIASVLDAGLDDRKRPFVTVELVEGQSLLQYCQLHHLSARDRVILMREVCEAVHHAHQRAVIHRDLKPANILVEHVDGRHRPRVIDFGIAKFVEEGANETMTRAGSRLGTPRYMSPEQDANLDVSDIRTDVYTLGVILCEVLTGEVPYPKDGGAGSGGSGGSAGVGGAGGRGGSGGSQSRSRSMRASRIAALSGSLNPEISRALRHDLARIVLRAAAFDPELRYGSAAALADDLQRSLDGRPVLATPPGMFYLARKFIARRKVTSAAILLAVISMVGGTIAAMYGLRRANESAVHAQLQQQRAEAEAALAAEINEFWLDIIRRGSPQEARRPDLQVREALDLAAPQLTDQILAPSVRRRLHAAFADAYQTLGLREAQLHHARQAWTLWEESGDGDVGDLVKLRVSLGSALMETHRLDEAKDLLLEVREVCETGDPVLRSKLPLVLHALSRVAHAEGDFSAAESLLLEAIAIAQAELGPRHPLTMTNIKQLSLTLVHSGRSQEAIERLEPLLVMQREELGPQHLEVISTMTTLAGARQSLGRFEEAERDYHELLAITGPILGEDHYYVVLLRNNYASLLRERGRHEDSEVLFREVYEARARMDGAEHPSTLQALVNLSMSLLSQRRFDVGLPMIRQAVESRDRVLGPEHPDTLNARQVLATVYHRTGQVEEAVAQFAMLVEQYRDALPVGHIRFAPLLRNYGLALIDLGRFADAVPLLIESYEVQLQAAGPDHPQTRRGLEIICSALEGIESPQAFAEWRERCGGGE